MMVISPATSGEVVPALIADAKAHPGELDLWQAQHRAFTAGEKLEAFAGIEFSRRRPRSARRRAQRRTGGRDPPSTFSVYAGLPDAKFLYIAPARYYPPRAHALPPELLEHPRNRAQKGFKVDSWLGFAPGGTPPDIVKRLTLRCARSSTIRRSRPKSPNVGSEASSVRRRKARQVRQGAARSKKRQDDQRTPASSRSDRANLIRFPQWSWPGLSRPPRSSSTAVPHYRGRLGQARPLTVCGSFSRQRARKLKTSRSSFRPPRSGSRPCVANRCERQSVDAEGDAARCARLAALSRGPRSSPKWSR